MRSQLKKIEDLGAAMEEALILDNKYTEHSTTFDKEKSGRLNHQEFKSCLRSLGYDLPMNLTKEQADYCMSAHESPT
ncbi:hypothetical protein CRUP_037915 [Coryphaenoides rupestris]|nr:hypothetical protein CRUP_037915 [Coryphaenoides rupestris]